MSFDSFSVDLPKKKPRSGQSFFFLESANQNQNLQFVQHRGTKDSQRQKELRISDLRAHAARVTHHNKRKQQAQKLAKEQQSWEDSKAKMATILRERTPPPSPSPFTFALSQSTRDPFGTSALSTVPLPLLDLLDVAWHNLNVAFRPARKGVSYPDVLMWRRELVAFPAISYSIIAGAATMSLTARQRLSPSQCQELHQARLQYTSLAVAQVRKELLDPVRSTSDALLFAVLCLGSHDDIEPDAEEDYTQQIISPLMMGSALHVFSRLKMSKIHFDALFRLIELKGGLDRVKLPIWQELMSFLVLVWATKEGIRPQLPFVDSRVVTLISQNTQNRSEGRLTPDSGETSFILPEGFADISLICQEASLREALQSAAQITQYVEQLCQNTCATNFHEVNNLRNKTQHQLTSLEPRSITSDSDAADCLYEVCRLSALEFSDMVIFPTPALTKVRQRLAHQLLAVLESLRLRKVWSQHPELLGWAATIGAVGSMNIPDDKQAFLRIFERKAAYTDSQAFLTSVRRFLWSELLTSRAQQIWAELSLSSSYTYRTPESIEDVRLTPPTMTTTMTNHLPERGPITSASSSLSEVVRMA